MNPGLPQCRWILYQLSHKGNSRILSLLQHIFLTQESNQGLLHCKWILYELSYQGPPDDLQKVKSLSLVQLLATLWTVTGQAPLSMGFSRPEYWNGLPFPSPGDLPNPGTKPGYPALQADTLPSEPPGRATLIVNALDLAIGTRNFQSKKCSDRIRIMSFDLFKVKIC